MTEVPAVVGVEPRADAAVAGSEQVEVESQSSTEVVASDAEAEDIALVELPESSLACPVFDLSPCRFSSLATARGHHSQRLT